MGTGDIDVISVQNLIETMNIEIITILKVDIEGSEFQVFDESSDTWIDKVKYLLIETHDSIISGAYERVNSRLIAHGFIREKSPRLEEDVWLFTNPSL